MNPIIWSRHPSHKPIKLEETKRKIVVNFGNKEIKEKYKGAIFVNHPSAVANSAEKIVMKVFMRSLVSTPDFGLKFDDVKSFPIVVKLKNHSRGRGMVKIDSQEELASFRAANRYREHLYYWEQYVQFDREFRVHCSRLNGEFFTVEKRRRKAASETIPVWLRNIEACRFKLKFLRPFGWHNMIEQCKNVLTALGLDLGGFDVGFNMDQRKFYIIECNSACGMQDKTREAYVKELNAICKALDT